MSEIKSIDLMHRIGNIGSIALQQATWWSENSRFVVVNYSEAGQLKELGLRLDLDKRVFLDHLEDAEADEALRDMAIEIWSIVAEARRMTDTI